MSVYQGTREKGLEEYMLYGGLPKILEYSTVERKTEYLKSLFKKTYLMENLIYNELRLRGMSVDVGVVLKNEKDANGVSVRKQLEVDFVCNQGSQRYYIQNQSSCL